MPSSFSMSPRLRRATLLGLGLLYLLFYWASLQSTRPLPGGGMPWLMVLVGAGLNFGPALPLLLLVWPLSGWLEKRGSRHWVLLHLLGALVFVALWHAMAYGLFWLLLGPGMAERARLTWFMWQALGGLLMYAAAAGGFTAYRALQRAHREAQANAQARELLVRAELAALRSRLNPHFLFNTLHSILALLRRDPSQAEVALLRRDPSQAEVALQRFSDLLRQVLDSERRDEERVSLEQELEFTRDYLELEALRLGERLQLDWQVDEAALACRLPGLSVQPLVENSIKHAFATRGGPGRLSVQASLQHGRLRVRVADDGPGCEPGAARHGEGLGLPTVSRRLQLAYGPMAGLQIETAPGQGFAVGFEVPAQ